MFLRTGAFFSSILSEFLKNLVALQLCNAIEAYGLTEAENSHRAVDDARATVLLLEAMAAEKDDLMRYIDLFGTHPKYGLSGKKISSVTYCPQPYDRRVPLYELTHTM